MPDWREIATRRLTPLALEAKRQEEIIAELANHLEDLYEDLVRQGKSEVEAVQFALSTVADWDELRREIQLAADEEAIMNYRMNYRAKALWLPGICTSALAALLLRLLQIPSAPAPHVFWPWQDIALVLYWRWLLFLPLIGALGAYWSRRAGGKLLERVLAASLYPLGLTCVLALSFCVALVFPHRVSLSIRLVGFAVYVLGWSITPCFLLLLGALPFLKRDAGESRPAAASH
jgi:hypothetical protein